MSIRDEDKKYIVKGLVEDTKKGFVPTVTVRQTVYQTRSAEVPLLVAIQGERAIEDYLNKERTGWEDHYDWDYGDMEVHYKEDYYYV